MVDIGSVNDKIIGGIKATVTKSAFINAIGWLIVGILVIAAIGWFLWWYFDNKKYNKKVRAHTIIHGYFFPTYNDKAKSVKLGKGGFEIIYLKKLKTWKLAHDARTGINIYDFYIMPDGYWYPGKVLGNIHQIDANKGLIPIITTNPGMRSQYTALEKQIDTLHAEKSSFWNKYGQWVMSIIFILIMGVFVWLSFREVSQFLGSGTALADKMNELGTTINSLAVNLCSNQAGGSGLIPA